MSIESSDRRELLPHAYGHEMELGIVTDVRGYWEEPYEMARSLYTYLPKRISVIGEMLTNGTRLYVQGAKGDTDGLTNIELASAECSGVRQMVTHARGCERFATDLTAQYTETFSILLNQEVQARMQMRVIDSAGSTKARHDNYGYSEPITEKDKKILRGHLQTRSFATGAGLVSEAGLTYSQKMTSVTHVEKYGFLSSFFRVEEDKISNRLEVRCSDHNISDWASTVRIGSVALAIALGRSDLLPIFTSPNHTALTFAKSANRLFMNLDGVVKPTADVLAAADYQQMLAEQAMDELPSRIDLPDELYLVAYELYKYCDDFKAFLYGKTDIATLADRADWAAKFNLLMQYRLNDSRFYSDASLNDIKARGFDLFYDRIHITGTMDEITVKEGTGYKLRKLNPTRFSVPEPAVIRAAMSPPPDTRAQVRVNLMQSGHALRADWENVTIRTEDNRKVQVDLEHPLQQAIDEQRYVYDAEFISKLARRQT